MNKPATAQGEFTDLGSGVDAGENEPLRRDVRLLGDLLGETIAKQHGGSLFKLVEEVRTIAKQARLGETAATRRLIDKLSGLPAPELLNLARTFTLFLNLANIAEQHHQIRQRRQLARAAGVDPDPRTPGGLAGLLGPNCKNCWSAKSRPKHCTGMSPNCPSIWC